MGQSFPPETQCLHLQNGDTNWLDCSQEKKVLPKLRDPKAHAPTRSPTTLKLQFLTTFPLRQPSHLKPLIPKSFPCSQPPSDPVRIPELKGHSACKCHIVILLASSSRWCAPESARAGPRLSCSQLYPWHSAQHVVHIQYYALFQSSVYMSVSQVPRGQGLCLSCHCTPRTRHPTAA